MSPNWSRALFIERIGDAYLVQSRFERLGLFPIEAIPELALAAATLPFGAREAIDPEWADGQRRKREELNALLPNRPYMPKGARLKLTLADLGLRRN